jgi:hypothetical protein
MSIEALEDLVERYIQAYNALDVEGMISLMHPQCLFRHVSAGNVTVSTTSLKEFRDLAEESGTWFSTRRQIVNGKEWVGDALKVDIDFQGVLAVDLPNGPAEGHTLKLTGKSVFTFRDGLIFELTDYADATT